MEIMPTTTYHNVILGQSRFAMRARKTFLIWFASLLLVPLCPAADSDARSITITSTRLSRADKDKFIYVRDFDLDPSNFKQDKGGITGKGYLLPPPPKSFLRRKHETPATDASKLVGMMSENLVRNLKKAGFMAFHLSATDPTPAEGIIVTGVFTELSEGNQMRRALLGFGSGKAKMDLYVTVADASSDAQPLYQASTQGSNGRRPGAVLALNPYAGAAGFVVKFGMTKNAPEKMIKKTASGVASQIVKQLNTDPATVEAAVIRH
jgi:Domain of unknown function (DUF4410)